MQMENQIVQKLRCLTPDKQGEVLDFVEFLVNKQNELPVAQPLHSLRGKFAHIATSSDDFAKRKQHELEYE